MFGMGKLYIEAFYQEVRKSKAPAFLQVKPRELKGPHPKRLRKIHFKFLLDGQALYCDIPLPPYQHDNDLPTWGAYQREVLGWWDRPGVEPAFLITQDMLPLCQATCRPDRVLLGALNR